MSVSTYLISPGVGEFFPEEAGVEALPFGMDVEGVAVFSIAFAAVTFAPSVAVGAGSSCFFSGAAGVVSTIERTLGFPTDPSPPIDNDLTTGAAGVSEVFGVGFGAGAGVLPVVDSAPVGRFAIIGVFAGVGCDC